MSRFKVYSLTKQPTHDIEIDASGPVEAVEMFHDLVLHNTTCDNIETVVVSPDQVSKHYRYFPHMPKGMRVFEMVSQAFHVLQKEGGRYAICLPNGSCKTDIDFATKREAQDWIDREGRHG